MNKNVINIAILEPSQIIFEGISNILLKSGGHCRVFRIDNLNNITGIDSLDVAIINPSQILNKSKEFASIKKNSPGTCWVGLVYSLFEKDILSLFDKTININDSGHKINALITKLGEEENQNNHGAEQEHLSEREIEVLKLMVKGLSNKEIADKLNISIHTVISHRKNISQKTGIKSQSGLTIYAISNKIIILEDFNG